MKRKIFITILVLTVVMTMSVVPGFAASKKITLVGEKDYAYLSNGKTQIEYSWEDTYNSKGQRTKLVNKVYNYDSGKQKVTTRTLEYKYSSGKLKTQITKENGKITNKITYTYKKNGKMSKLTSWKYNSKTGKYNKDTYTKYTYSSKKETITTYNKKDKQLSKTVYTLDSKGRAIKEVYYDGTEKYSITENKYYSNGKLKKSSTVYIDGGTDVFDYDKSGNMTCNVYTLDDGSVMKLEYTYNKYNLITKEIYTWSSDDYSEKEVTKYSYSNYYNSNKKYPKTVILKRDGEKVYKYERSYKKV